MNHARYGCLVLWLALAGCGRCGGAPETASPPVDARELPAQPEAAPATRDTAVVYTLDPARSKLRLRHAANEVEMPLELPGLSGTATVDGGRLKSVTVTADVRTLQGDERAVELKEAGWLDVAKFPAATFTSTHIDDHTTGEDSHQIGGIVDLLGQPRDHGFPANFAIGEKELQGSAEIYLDGARFGIRQDADTVYAVSADLVFVRAP